MRTNPAVYFFLIIFLAIAGIIGLAIAFPPAIDPASVGIFAYGTGF